MADTDADGNGVADCSEVATPEGYQLSVNADFSTSDVSFSVSGALYAKLWSDQVDFDNLKKAEWEVKQGGSRVKGKLTNNGDGTYTASIPLGSFGEVPALLKLKIEDNARVKFEVRDIAITFTP